MTTNQAWEEVLAAVEADVRRTEELLADDARAAAEPAVSYLAPAQWQLPMHGPELPPLEQMPAIPAELRERIRELRLRIVALQIELSTELAELRSAQVGPIARAASRRLAAAPQARFFDSRV